MTRALVTVEPARALRFKHSVLILLALKKQMKIKMKKEDLKSEDVLNVGRVGGRI